LLRQLVAPAQELLDGNGLPCGDSVENRKVRTRENADVVAVLLVDALEALGDN
jgi:hypothetical protein